MIYKHYIIRIIWTLKYISNMDIINGQFIHFFIVLGEMRYFNMSSKEANQKLYKNDDPPKYADKFKDIKTPILLWSAEGDSLVMPDVGHKYNF